MNTDLLPDEGLVLCAVSGGADSMYLLERLRELGYPVAAAHFDHGLRGEASRRDAEFVRDWCAQESIPFVGGVGDAAACAAEKRLGTEEAARTLRYAFLETAADELGAAVITTAHTADDNAETVLMRLTRGAGAKGLGGIPPRRGRIVRPMLDVTREEVMDYLSRRGIPHVEDETNAGDHYMRNRIRHRVTPVLREENPAFAEAVGRTARLMREDEAYLDELAGRFLEDNLRAGTLPADQLAALPAPVARRVVRRLAGDIPLEHTERVLRLAETGGSADIRSMRVTVSEGRIRFGTAGERKLEERLIAPGAELELPEAGLRLRCEKIPFCPADVHKSFNTFFFIYENIYGTIQVGARRPGDAYRPAGRGCTKTLKSLFMEMHVPSWERDLIPVLRDEIGILGVYGFPPDERCAAAAGDGEVLRIEFIRGYPGNYCE